MAVGLSQYAANKCLEAMLRNASFVVTQGFVKLHVGDPGAVGTANPAVETTRKGATFSAAAAGSAATSADLVWTSIAGSEDATHFSVWDASTGGNFLFSGTVTLNPYTAGDTVTLTAAAVTATFSALAA